VRPVWAALALCLVPTVAGAALPAFKPVRADEDYAYLRDSSGDAWDERVKYLPVGAGGDVYLSLGGEMRLRADTVDAPRFGIGGERPDSFLLTRTLFSADLHLGTHVRVFGELGVHRDIGKTDPPSPSDRDSADVQLLFADLVPDDTGHWRVRVGRQEIMLNAAQRFVSVREGPNIRQSFDGVSARYADGAISVDAFYLRPVTIEPGAFNDRRNSGQAFYGAYGSWRFAPGDSVDLYVLELDRDGVRFGGVAGNERRISYGARLAGKSGRIDYDLEGMIQRGRFGGQSIRAWGMGLTAGYTFDAPWSPRLGIRFDAGSGDRDRSDGILGTFNPLFPRGAYFNESALTSFANLRALRFSLGAAPVKAVQVEASVLVRGRESRTDSIYLQPFTPLAPASAAGGRYVGTALQLDASWQLDVHTKIQGEVVYQTAGKAIRALGGEDVCFAMLITQFRF
jgi:hypothetical protein